MKESIIQFVSESANELINQDTTNNSQMLIKIIDINNPPVNQSKRVLSDIDLILKQCNSSGLPLLR